MPIWTPETTAELTRLWATGLSASRIGDALGPFTKNQVLGKARRLGLKGRASCFKLPPLQPGKPRLSNGINRPHVPLTAYTGPPGRGCKWPHDDFIARIRAHLEPFCSAPTIAGTSWCGEHHRRAYARAST